MFATIVDVTTSIWPSGTPSEPPTESEFNSLPADDIVEPVAVRTLLETTVTHARLLAYHITES